MEGSILLVSRSTSLQSCMSDNLHIKDLAKVRYMTTDKPSCSPRLLPVSMFRRDTSFHPVDQDLVGPRVVYPEKSYGGKNI